MKPLVPEDPVTLLLNLLHQVGWLGDNPCPKANISHLHAMSDGQCSLGGSLLSSCQQYTEFSTAHERTQECPQVKRRNLKRSS